MISARTRRQLEQVDWDFSEHLHGTSKTIHWYPGTYPADIPTTIIQALSKPNDLIFDPYGGVGTTAIEAVRQARKAWLVEANPIGCLVSYVSCGVLFLKAFKNELLLLLISYLRALLNTNSNEIRYQYLIETESGIGDEIDKFLEKYVRPIPKELDLFFQKKPVISHLSPWYDKQTLHDILTLLHAINDTPIGAFGRLLGKTMISAIIRASSSQTQSWGHIADNVCPKEFLRKDVIRLAQNWITRFEGVVNKTQVTLLPPDSTQEPRLWITLHNWALPNPPPIIPIDMSTLMVTSPPYAGAIDYTLSQRLSLYLFGYIDTEIIKLSREEFGARRKRYQSNSLEVWAKELANALGNQLEFMKKPSYAAFVLPHKDAGRDVGIQVLEDRLAKLGWEKSIKIDRSIRQVRARQSWTSIKKETLYIFGN